jgi:hypothetical protein
LAAMWLPPIFATVGRGSVCFWLVLVTIAVVLGVDTEIEFDSNDEDSYYSYYSVEDPGADLIVQENSDYLFLYTDMSTLPFLESQWGVFARMDIPQGEIICEHRGKVVREGYVDQNPGLEPFTTYLPGADPDAGPDAGEPVSIVGYEVCAYINDAAHIIESIDADGRVRSPYSVNELRALAEADKYDSLPPTPGFAYNAMFNRTRMGKVFIYATEDIRAGQEIFYPYGL